MDRSVIDQSNLINEVLSFRDDFELSGPAVRTMKQTGEYCLDGFQWLLSDRLSGSEELVGTWQGMTWVGVKAA